MDLLYPVSKSHMAFIFAVNRLMANQKHLYLWTFTFADVPQNEIAMNRWHELQTKIRWNYRLNKGLRVIEVHPGKPHVRNPFGLSHGLHFHALFNRRICVHWMRRIARQCHFGWKGRALDVRPVDIQGALYLGKYLTKDQPDLPKGMRRWGAVNWPECNRKNDIEIESAVHRNIRELQYQTKIPQFTPDIIHTVFVNTRRYGDMKDWPIDKYHYGQKARVFFGDDDWRTHLGCNREASEQGKLPRGNDLRTPEQKQQNQALRWKHQAQWIAKRRGIKQNSAPQAEKIFNDKVSNNETDRKLDTTDYVLDKIPRKWVGMATAKKVA